MLNEEPKIEKIDLQKVVDNEDSGADNISNAAKNYTDFENKMMSHGWDPEGTLSAEDWIDNGFKIKNRKLDNLFSAVEELKTKMDKEKKDAYAQARADLEAERIAAIEEADLDKVKEIEKKQQTMVDPSVREYADAFTERNKTWLTGTSYKDMEMAAICGIKDKLLFEQKLPPKEHFAQLEAHMKEKYPEVYGLEKPISSVEGGQKVAIKQSAVGDKKKLTWDDLDQFQKQACKNLENSGKMKREDYIKKLQELSR